jgi:hypothetical protein
MVVLNGKNEYGSLLLAVATVIMEGSADPCMQSTTEMICYMEVGLVAGRHLISGGGYQGRVSGHRRGSLTSADAKVC